MKRKLLFFYALITTTCFCCCNSNDESIPEGTILPICLTDGEIADFFNTELKERHHSNDSYNISTSFFYDIEKHGGTPGINKDTVCIINSRQELADVYQGKKELPAIDFNKYTLIIGQQNMPYLGFFVAKKVLLKGDNGLILNLYTKNEEELLSCAIQNLYFWGIYPKLSQKTISVNIFKEYIYRSGL